MKTQLRRCLAAVLVCALLVTAARPAHADTLKDDARNAVIAIVAVTAVLTVGIVLLLRHDYGIRGCTASGPGGLQLHEEGDAQVWTLLGDTATIKSGERVKIGGKKKKKDATGNRTYIVSKVKKDYGPCPVTP